jgi:uncharacterized protein (DUF433 family)
MKALREDRPADPLVIAFSKHVTFDLCDDFERWSTIVRRYERNRSEYIVRDPEIMGGLPVIKGTRVPVYTILSMVDGGDSVADIREDYPYLSSEAIEVFRIVSRWRSVRRGWTLLTPRPLAAPGSLIPPSWQDVLRKTGRSLPEMLATFASSSAARNSILA